MTKQAKKLSRREREEQRQTRRLLIFGGAAVGLMGAAGVGVTLLPPSFPTLEGEGSISERLMEANLADHVLNLTPSKAKADILVIGTTDCSFCRSFVEDGLADTVALAKKHGLGLTYAPTGSSKTSLASTRLLSCFARGSDADPVKVLQTVYAAAEELGRGADLVEVAGKHGGELGVPQSMIDACLAEDALEITRRIQSLSQSFPIKGTPMFYVANAKDADRINWFSGWTGMSGLRRQIEAARDV